MHPDSTGHCLKVPIKPGLGKNCPQCRLDVYIAARLKSRGVPFVHTVDCLGWVETNMGPAIMLQRVLNQDGSPSMTLKSALEHGLLDWNMVKGMLYELRTWAIQYAVVISELNIKNLMLRTGSDGDRLVVVDGLGGRKPDMVFHLRSRIPWMARHKTLKRWPREYNKVKDAVMNILK